MNLSVTHSYLNHFPMHVSAGTGLLSMIFSPLVRLYTVTDIPALLPLIRKNISHTFPDWRQPTKPGCNISVEELDWLALQAASQSFRPRLLPSGGAVDLILVVDCIYHPSLLPALVETIDVLAITEKTAVVVVVELRSEDVIRIFLELWLRKSTWRIWRVGGELLKINYAMWIGWKVSK